VPNKTEETVTKRKQRPSQDDSIKWKVVQTHTHRQQ
jgi:hypothetical protein